MLILLVVKAESESALFAKYVFTCKKCVWEADSALERRLKQCYSACSTPSLIQAHFLSTQTCLSTRNCVFWILSVSSLIVGSYFVLASKQQPMCCCRWITSLEPNLSSMNKANTLTVNGSQQHHHQSQSLLTAGMTHFIRCNKELSHLMQNIEKSS